MGAAAVDVLAALRGGDDVGEILDRAGQILAVTGFTDGDVSTAQEFEAVKAATKQMHGAYAIAVFCRDEPQRGGGTLRFVSGEPTAFVSLKM